MVNDYIIILIFAHCFSPINDICKISPVGDVNLLLQTTTAIRIKNECTPFICINVLDICKYHAEYFADISAWYFVVRGSLFDNYYTDQNNKKIIVDFLNFLIPHKQTTNERKREKKTYILRFKRPHFPVSSFPPNVIWPWLACFPASQTLNLDSSGRLWPLGVRKKEKRKGSTM